MNFFQQISAYLGLKKYSRAYDHFVRAVELKRAFADDLSDIINKLRKIKDRTQDIEYSFSVG